MLTFNNDLDSLYYECEQETESTRTCMNRSRDTGDGEHAKLSVFD